MNIEDGNIEAAVLDMDGKSAPVMEIVTTMVGKYSKELDEYVMTMHEDMMNGKVFSDEEIQEAIIKIPVLMYFAIEGLEIIGTSADLAKTTKMEKVNESYMAATGTIPEKTKTSELAGMEDEIISNVYARAYKMLNMKIGKAESLYTGMKKVFDKRISEIDAAMLEKKYAGLAGRGE